MSVDIDVTKKQKVWLQEMSFVAGHESIIESPSIAKFRI